MLIIRYRDLPVIQTLPINEDEDPGCDCNYSENDIVYLAAEAEEVRQSNKDKKNRQQNESNIPCESHFNFLPFS